MPSFIINPIEQIQNAQQNGAEYINYYGKQIKKQNGLITMPDGKIYPENMFNSVNTAVKYAPYVIGAILLIWFFKK